MPTVEEETTLLPESAPAAHAHNDRNKDVDEDGEEDDDEGNGAASPTSAEKENKRITSKSYVQLVHDAIVALKDRTGSSLPAIKKWILQKYPALDGPQFRFRLNQALKTGVKSERFKKVKSSFKINIAYTAKQKKKKAASKKIALDTAQHQQQDSKMTTEKKLKELEKKLTPEKFAKAKADLEKREEAARKRAEADAKAKEIAERIRRRRFPIEDTKLHAEDKELGVKPPKDVTSRPYLPYFWHMTLPLDDPGRLGKTSSSVLQASKADTLDIGNRGLVSDLLQVYHFFRGDVHFVGDDPENPLVPDFTLKHLVFATEQVMNGNAKRSRLVPPLICHLFVTCLQILCQPPDQRHTGSERQLHLDLHKYLLPALSPTSWADVCFLYMDAMERYYGSDASRDQNILQPIPIDAEYILGVTDKRTVFMTPPAKQSGGTEENTVLVPDGYLSYLGDSKGALARGFHKIGRQDPWLLTAEELMALLRALTDDVLANHQGIGDDIDAREEEMQTLLKAKRAADAKFRKVRLAFEGPKKTKKPGATDKNDENHNNELDGKGAEGETGEKEETFKPTATKKQFDSALKAQIKATEAYEKGTRKLVARTEPIGYDRNFNAVYCFRHDPDVLYVEDKRCVAHQRLPDINIEKRSWHIIETASLFDLYVSSLDIRGKREHDLYDELMGPQGTQQSLRRFLRDDIKESATEKSLLKQQEALKERLEVARAKCNEEQGRRSGRLAGQAELELMQVESEIEILEKQMKGQVKSVEKVELDFNELTGLNLLREFDGLHGIATRRTRGKRAASEAKHLATMHCSRLLSTGNIDGTGSIGYLASQLFELEEMCEALVPWEREDITRGAWISKLEEAVTAWNDSSPVLIGNPPEVGSDDKSVTEEEPGNRKRASLQNGETPSKRPRFSISSHGNALSAPSLTSVMNAVKNAVLDLEERIADATNVDVATRDADLADENMSVDGSDDDEADKQRLEMAWKRLLYRIKESPTRSHVQIRELLVSAIAAARKAHVPEIVAQLRAALLLHHPNAAGECKTAVVKVLESNGGYDPAEDDDAEADEGTGNADEDETEPTPSVLSAEAATLISSLGGSSDASRADWRQAVKSSKSISRLAALASAFVTIAKEQLKKLQVERDELLDALDKWEKDTDRRTKKGRSRKSQGEDEEPISEVWTNVSFTDEIVMAKAEKYPWWPAKMCHAKDPEIAKTLARLNRCLVALIGEMGGLRVVKLSEVRTFTGEKIEDDANTAATREMRSQLEDCLSMARRILRGRAKQTAVKSHQSQSRR